MQAFLVVNGFAWNRRVGIRVVLFLIIVLETVQPILPSI